MIPIIFADPVQVRGLWMHHGVCGINLPKNKAPPESRMVWVVSGHLQAMEREIVRLVRRHDRDPITHRTIWTFFEDSGATIHGVPEAEARRRGMITPVSDPDGCADDDVESTLMMRFEHRCACSDDSAEDVMIVSNVTFMQPYCEHQAVGLYTRDVPVFLAPTICRETTMAMFARDDGSSAVVRHLQAYYQAKEKALARHARHGELHGLAQAALDTMPRVCDACGRGARHVCPGCRIIRYCSPACQRQAWRSKHKSACATFRNLAAIIVLEANTPRSPA